MNGTVRTAYMEMRNRNPSMENTAKKKRTSEYTDHENRGPRTNVAENRFVSERLMLTESEY